MKKVTLTLFLALLTVIFFTGVGFAEVSGDSQLEQQMLELINKERSQVGLAPLTMDNNLVQLARLKSQDMIDKNYFSHTSPTYGDPFQMMSKYGVEYLMAGENLAGNSTLAGAHESLMNSPGHRANILKPEYTHVGIGIVKGGPYGMMFTQMFTKPKNAEPAKALIKLPENEKKEEPKEQNTNLKIFHNSREIKFPDIEPYINSDQRIMIPLRFVSQELGFGVDWDTSEQKVTIKKGDNIINLWVGKNIFLKNTQVFMGDTQPEIYNSRTMVPLRLVSELLGCKVTWYPTLYKAVIN
ncbi:MAG: stalk domain-containing protein [Peptococcales bacterium]|jgi:uncharacterized YkwD family protein